MNATPLPRRRCRGFTMIELMAVVVVIGILLSILAPRVMTGGTASARATSLWSFATSGTSIWTGITLKLGVPRTVAGNPMVRSGNTALDLLVNGDSPSGLVTASYSAGYAAMGVTPLRNSARVTTAPTLGVAGAYTLEGYAFTLQDGPAGSYQYVFQAVPTEVVQSLFEGHGTGTFNAATPVTSGPVQYTAAANAIHTVTLEVY